MPITLDPALFRPEAVTAETRAFLDRIGPELGALPGQHEVPVEVTRAARDEGRGIFPPGGPLEGSEWRELPAGGRVRVSPAPGGEPRAVYLHIHGGGWALGRPSHYDRANQALAAATGVTVVSVEYRLAPEHVWPANLEDCLAAARWLLDGGLAEFGVETLFIGGESAGAHLSAAVLVALGEARGRFAGAVLNYGCFDAAMTPSARGWGERKLVLSTPTIAFFAETVDPAGAMRADPAGTPLKADLSGMPDALFQVGTEDPLLDDSLMMAARWAGAGAGAELAVYPGGIHAFDAFPELPIAREFQARQAGFVLGRL
ncbi:MAG: alpha/beta hydrolase fold domain-containing protein [Pseudomonadota bacterium]